MASGSSKVDLISGNSFTVIARGGNSRARGLVMRDESQIKMGTNNRFHVEEACESRAGLLYRKYLLISFSYRVLHTDLRDVDDEVDQNELHRNKVVLLRSIFRGLYGFEQTCTC